MKLVSAVLKTVLNSACCELQVTDLYDPKEQWASFLINAIKAKEFHTRDVNYIVRQGEASHSTQILDAYRKRSNS